jgi:glutaredoxin
VKKEHGRLDEMLELSGNRRQVPVIVEGDKVSVGFGGS